VSKSQSHRVEQGRDVVLRRLRVRSLLLFFRRPYKIMNISSASHTISLDAQHGMYKRCFESDSMS
jgi:hypothetical protein